MHSAHAAPVNDAFEVLGPLRETEAIATGPGIRDLRRIRKVHGPGRWRKVKGKATIKLADGSVHLAELHWYEAHGVGRREMKIKRLLSD